MYGLLTQMAALADLERDLHEANQEFKQALSDAGMSHYSPDHLSHQLDETLARLCTERQAARAVLDAPDRSLSRANVEARNS